MSMVRFRLIGSRADADAVIAGLHSIDGIEHVEEVHDLTPGMRDDSSSSESVADDEGHIYFLEVDAEGDELADTVREQAEVIASDCSSGIEFVEEF